MARAPKKPGGAYEVGYGRPPRAHRFKPGQSGNPRGRPKGRPSFQELFLSEAGRLVAVKTHEGVTRMPKEQAILRKLLNRAIEGDPASIRLALSYLVHAQRGTGEAHEAGAEPFDTPSDEETIRRMLARFAALGED